MRKMRTFFLLLPSFALLSFGTHLAKEKKIYNFNGYEIISVGKQKEDEEQY